MTPCPVVLFVLAAGIVDVWRALSGAVENNPNLALLGLLAVMFTAGFGTRKLFEDRALGQATNALSDTKAQLDHAKSRIADAEKADEERKALVSRISQCLDPEGLRRNLAEHLNQWPVEKRDLLNAAVIRQLLLVPGCAWLFTPKNSTLVKVEFEPRTGASHVSMETNSGVDPIRKLREFVANEQERNAAVLELAIYGIANVRVDSATGQSTRLHVRQGPGESWTVQRDELQRVTRLTPEHR